MRISSLYKWIVCALVILFSHNVLVAEPSIEDDNLQKQKILLIINSYSETAPWSREIVNPISMYIARDESVHAENYCLNNVLITDSAKYNIVKDLLFETYKERHPDYLVVVGALSFTLRDEIKKQWGNIPMVVIARDMSLAPAEYFFTGYNNPMPIEPYPSISDLRGKFNFTAIYIPDLYKETIDLMVKMRPKMEELVLFGDAIFLNRRLAVDIKSYLNDAYPNIKFKWVRASAQRHDELQYYFVHELPRSGLLMSTWYFEKMGPFGYPTLGYGDMYLMRSSVNPVFSLHQSYMSIGSIGGVYLDNDRIENEIIDAIDKMIHGADLRDVKFYTNKQDCHPVINYAQLNEYGMSESDCPQNTEFLFKPLSFWQKYGWQMLAVSLVLLCLLVFLFWRSVNQRHKIDELTKHQRFVESMPVPYSKARMVYDDNGNIYSAKYTVSNEAFVKLLEENAYRKNPYRLFPDDFLKEKTTQMVQTVKPVSFLYHFENTDNYYLFNLCMVNAEAKKDGSTNEFDIFAIDVTTRQKTELNLKSITKKLDMTLNIAHLIPWEWNIDTDMLDIESSSLIYIKKDTDLTSDVATDGKSCMSFRAFVEMIHPDDRSIMVKIHRDMLQGAINNFKCQVRLLIPHTDETKIEWIEILGTVTSNGANGMPSTVTGAIMVITDRKNQELDLIAAKEKANEADKMKSAFLANMSHEIRTPLNAIVGFSGLMCETDDVIKRREFSRIINQNNDMLLSLVNDVLDLAKIESNTLDLLYTPVDINNLLDAIAETAKMRLHKGVVLNIAAGAVDCYINTDGNRVSQILINLLTNAAKFTNKGSITFGYDIVDNKEIYFYVKDTGIGVSPENQKLLFKRFNKINNFMQGNGLGLSICKSIVELMGGEIGMKSRGEGKGSTFWFTLPYEPVEERPEGQPVLPIVAAESLDDLVDKPHNQVDVSTPVVTIPEQDTDEEPIVRHTGVAEVEKREQKVILAAEDIEGNFTLLKYFVPKKYTLLHAWDGREAIQMFKEHKPDLVLMDISMPDMDGYQAAEAIRKINPNVPIIAVTAYSYASDRIRILKSGFNDYISKPVSRDDLQEAIARYI